MTLQRQLRDWPRYYVFESDEQYYIRESHLEKEDEEYIKAPIRSFETKRYFLYELPGWYYAAILDGSARNALGIDSSYHNDSKFIFNWVVVKK